MNVVVHDGLTEQYRFPRSKKRRIRAKWAKDLRNFRLMTCSFITGDTIHVPRSLEQVIRQLKQEQAAVQYVHMLPDQAARMIEREMLNLQRLPRMMPKIFS